MMRRPTSLMAFILLSGLLALNAGSACGGDELTTRVLDVARPLGRSPHAPKASDVSMRSLYLRPMDGKDPHDTLKALDAFHVTRLEWCYLTFEAGEREKIARVKRSGRIFGGSGAGMDGLKGLGREARKAYCILDLSGEAVIPSFEKTWAHPRSPGCMNNPEYLRRHVEYYRPYVEAGVDVIERDEPAQNDYWARAGVGCYCARCMAGFREFLAEQFTPGQLKAWGVENIATFNYAELLRAQGANTAGAAIDWSDPSTIKSVRAHQLHPLFRQYQQQVNTRFTEELRAAVSAMAPGGYLPMSCNNTSFQAWAEPYYRLYDFALSELMMNSADPVHLYIRARAADAAGKVQVFGAPKTLGVATDESRMRRLRRQVVATSYAVGGLGVVPWDVFEQNEDGQHRFFGLPEDYAALFGFVRAIAPYLDDYQDAGGFGPGLAEKRYGAQAPLAAEGGSGRLYLFPRAAPGDASRPVAVHLVDWAASPRPFTLKLRRASFAEGAAALRVKLLTPAPYDQKSHAACEERAGAMLKRGERFSAKQAPAYQPLVQTAELHPQAAGEWTRVDIPALAPWGVLVVEIAPARPAK